MSTLLIKLMNARTLPRRSAALSIAFLTILILGWLWSIAYEVLAAKHRELIVLRETAGRLATIANLKGELVEQKEQPTDVGNFLAGESENIILANLQNRLTSISENQGAAVVSVSNAPKIEEEGVSFIGLRAVISGEMLGVQGTIFELETKKPALFLRKIKVQSTVQTNAAKIDGPVQLTAQFFVYGAISN